MVGRGRRRAAEVDDDEAKGVVLVAPYGGVRLTRRWCATVRRGRHTKSAGYSGHVTGYGGGPRLSKREILPSSFNGSVLLVRRLAAAWPDG